MYSKDHAKDAALVAKAVASNLLAWAAPATYVRLTRQTGRGSLEERPEEVASYFMRSFDDYQLWLPEVASPGTSWLKGKCVLEYGPGDILGTALLCVAHGAMRVECVDRFPLQAATPKNVAVYRTLLDELPSEARARANAAFVRPGDPSSGFRSDLIEYRVTSDGLARRPHAFDLIVSRAVLEHVNKLSATLNDIHSCLRSGGLAVHNVDLRSHNLDRYRAYDFLTWPEWLYSLMYRHKGFPNRLRVDAYRQLANTSGLEVVALQPTGRLERIEAEAIRPYVAKHLRCNDVDEFSWTGFWMVLGTREPGR